VPAPVAFLDLTPDDIPAGLRLSRQSGWNQTEADWRALLAPSSVFRGARVGGAIVGTAGAVVYGDRLAWVCMVLVDVAERGRGLGTSLVSQVLERLPPRALVGLDATPTGQAVYEKLGFESDRTLARLQTTSPATLAAAPPSVRPMAEADLSRVVSRDLQVFGADRGRVLRSALAAASEYAWCVDDGETLVGYAFGRPGNDADQIGPVVALETTAAAAMVAATLCARPGRRFFLDATPRPEWRRALADLGFLEQRGFTRMYRGGRTLVPAGEEQCLATFGPEFG
jgi:GNAT superfamily N-acetyltransferase